MRIINESQSKQFTDPTVITKVQTFMATKATASFGSVRAAIPELLTVSDGEIAQAGIDAGFKIED